LFKQCPKCKIESDIPDYLKVCFKCSYPKHDRYFWENGKKGDKVYISGNISPEKELIPHAYGPHTVHDVKKRTLTSSNDTIFNHYEDTLLILKKENKNG